jgi:hypothetical protein
MKNLIAMNQVENDSPEDILDRSSSRNSRESSDDSFNPDDPTKSMNYRKNFVYGGKSTKKRKDLRKKNKP